MGRGYIAGASVYEGDKVQLVGNDFFLGKQGRVYSLDANNRMVQSAPKFFDEKWILDMTGVKTRYHIKEGNEIYNLNEIATRNALAQVQKDEEKVDSIVTSGVTSKYNFATFPSHAMAIQGEIDLSNVQYSMDIATHQNSVETANEIADALYKQHKGISIGVFAKTLEMKGPKKVDGKLYGDAVGFAIYLEGSREVVYSTAKDFGHLKNPEHLQHESWRDQNRELLQSQYQEIADALDHRMAYDCINPGDVKSIFVINQTQRDMPVVPTNAYMQMQLLGIKELRSAYDVATACAGTPVAFMLADGSIDRLANGKVGIVSIGEALETISDIHDPRVLEGSKYMDMNNVMWGTRAESFVIDRSAHAEKGFRYFTGKSNPYGDRLAWIQKDAEGYLRMPAGGEVMKEAVKRMSKLIADSFAYITHGMSPEQIQAMYFEHHPHNANIRIVGSIVDRMVKQGIPGKIIQNIHEIGNCSAASCASITAGRYPELKRLEALVSGPALGGSVVDAIYWHQF